MIKNTSTLEKLHEKIKSLPTLEKDKFGECLGIIHENLRLADSHAYVIIAIQSILPILKPPCHFLLEKQTAKLKIQSNLQKLQDILKNLENNQTFIGRTFYKPIKQMEQIYETFLDENLQENQQFDHSTIQPKAQINIIGLGCFNIDLKIALELLSLNFDGKLVKKNSFGTHAVCRLNEVFYKPNSTGRHFISPAIEFAVHSMYNLLHTNIFATAPTELIKIKNIFLTSSENSNNKNSLEIEKTVQAALEIEGILLCDYIHFINIIPLFKNKFPKNYKEILVEILEFHWENDFLDKNQHLKCENLDFLPFDEIVSIIIHEYLCFFKNIDGDKKLKEFIFDGDLSNITIQDFRTNIYNHSSRGVIGVLGLLYKYPSLAYEEMRNSTDDTIYMEPNSFVKLTDFYFSLKKLNKLFPKLSKCEIIDHLHDFIDLIDKKQFSYHIISSILLNPCDHKSDNLMILPDKKDSNNGKFLSLKIVGIDNDLITSDESCIHSILYLLPQMNDVIDISIIEQISQIIPEEFIFDWLIILEQQNQKYLTWEKQKILIHSDLFEEDGNPCLSIPLKLENQYIPQIFDKLKKMSSFCTIMLTMNKQITNWDLLEAIQPNISNGYKKSLSEYKNDLELAYRFVYKFIDKKKSVNEHNNDILNKEITHSLISDVAFSFFNEIQFDKLSILHQCKLFNKFLTHFPSKINQYNKIPTIFTTKRKKCFFLSIENGFCSLVAFLLEFDKTSPIADHETNLIHELDEYGNNGVLLACLQLKKSMIKLLIYHKINIFNVNKLNQNFILICFSQLKINGKIKKIYSIIKYFIKVIPSIPWNHIDKLKHWTCLHYLVHFYDENDDSCTILEQILYLLVEQNIFLDFKDNLGFTPLDYAFLNNKHKLISILIHHGGGSIVHYPYAKQYFTHHKHNDEITKLFHLILERSLFFRWYYAIELLKQKNVNKNSKNGSNLILLTGSNDFFGTMYVDKKEFSFFNDQGDIHNNTPFGRRNVFKYSLFTFNQFSSLDIYLKQYPEMPGIEFAVGNLFDKLIGHGTSKFELVKVEINQKKKQKIIYPLIISQGIEGNNLYNILRNKELSKELNEKLDKQLFSELFLASLLVNFEDAKPDNFIAERMFNGKIRLISIDNDHAFVPPISRKQNDTVLVKCILYCLEIMNEPINIQAKDKFLSHSPEKIIHSWLQDLIQQNQLYLQLFDRKYHEKFLKESKKHPSTLLTIPFANGVIYDIYKKFETLQQILKKNTAETLTHLEILRLVIPILGVRYESAFFSFTTPMDRFLYVSREQYFSSNQLETLLNSRQVLRLMNIRNLSYGNETLSPSIALHEFLNLQKQIGISETDRNNIRNQLYSGNIKHFENILLDTEKEKILNDSSEDGFDFLQVCKQKFSKQKQNLSPSLHKDQSSLKLNVLNCIIKGNYRKFFISNCDLLSSRYLRLLIQHSPQIISLSLCNCIQISNKDIQLLSSFKYLSNLILKNISSISGPLILTHLHTLRKLSIFQCQSLHSIDITNKVMYLELKGNLNLTTINQYPSNSLNLLKKLVIKNCPKLYPWNEIFEPTNHTEDMDGKYHDILNIEISLKYIPLHFQFEKNIWQLIISVCTYLPHYVYFAFKNILKLFDFTFSHCINYLKYQKNLSFGLDPFGIIAFIFKDEICKLDCNNYLAWKKLVTDDRIFNLISHNDDSFLHFLFDNNHLDLSYSSLTDLGFTKLIDIDNVNINSLNFRNCTLNDFTLLLFLGKFSASLTSLNIRNCNNITDESLINISKYGSHLQSLDIQNCQLLTDKAFNSLKYLKHLEKVNFSCCNLVHSFLICNSFNNLHILNLSNCPYLYDKTLSKITNPSLKSINLSSCQRISDIGLNLFFKNNPNIISVNISGCHYISERSFHQILLPCLEVLVAYKITLQQKKGWELIFSACKNLKKLGIESKYSSLIGNMQLLSLVNITYWDTNAHEYSNSTKFSSLF